MPWLMAHQKALEQGPGELSLLIKQQVRLCHLNCSKAQKNASLNFTTGE